MLDKSILSDDSLSILCRVQSCLNDAQEILEESNCDYIARRLFMDQLYIKIDEIIYQIRKVKLWVEGDNVVCPIDFEWFGTSNNMWDLKKK